MSRILSVATTFPPHTLRPDQVRQELRRILGGSSDILELLLGMVDSSGVKNRHLFQPLEHVVKERSLEQQGREYARGCIELGREVTKKALERAGLGPREVDLFITVSCTGFMIPSVDAYLMNELGFRPDCRRLPITELGCAGGASAVSRAADFLAGRERGVALVVAVELPALTFQSKDLTLPAMISALIFGDGAAGVVIGKGFDQPGAEILETSSYLFPDSTRAMGFDLKTTGVHIVLRKDVPELVRRELIPLSGELLGRRGLSREDLAFFAIHPGGKKILEYIADELGITKETLSASWSVLEQVGNLSSATVLAVYEAEIERRRPKAGEHGLMAAFGPGFSAEMLLLRWAEGAEGRRP